jgi:hypothetical protein
MSGTDTFFMKPMTSPTTRPPNMPTNQIGMMSRGWADVSAQVAPAEDEHEREERQGLHDDVVEGDPAGVDRAGARTLVHRVELLFRPCVLH